MIKPTRVALLVGLAVVAITALGFFLRQPPQAPAAPRSQTLPETPTNPDAPTVAPQIAPLERKAEGAPAVAQEKLTGRVVAASKDEKITSVELTLEQEVPAFIQIEMIAGTAQNARAKDEPKVDHSSCTADGVYEITGERLVGYLVAKDPMYCVRDAIYVDAREKTTTRDVRIDPAGIVRGVVRDPKGIPLADVQLQIRPKVGIDIAFNRESKRKGRDAKADATGRFEIAHVPAGIDFDLAVVAPGYLKQWRVVRAVSGTAVDCDFELSAGADLSGRVRQEGGEPVAGAKVRLRQSSMRVDAAAPQRFDTGDVESKTEPDGRFTLHGVPPGNYFIEASHPDFVRASLRDLVVPVGGLKLQDDLVLKGGERISGFVFDNKGAPVPKADVGLRRTSSFFMGGAGLSPESAEDLGGSRAQADDAGHFSSPPLAGGEYDVVASKAGFVQSLAKGVKVGATDVRLTLESRGSVEGVVISLETSEPVLEFHVAALRPFEMSKIMEMQSWEPVRHVVNVSKKGRYKIDDLAAGEYTVAVTAAGLARGEVEHVVVKQGETTHAVNFFMKKESVIHGHVVDKTTREPIEGARITTKQGMDALQQDPLGVEAEGVSDSKGAFEMRGMKPGRYTLTASKHSRAPGAAGPFALGDGDTLDDITIEMTKGGRVRGRVTDKNNAPSQGLMITAQKLGGIMPAMTTTDSDGSYQLDGLAPGSYSVTRLSQLALGSENMTEGMLKGMQTKSVRVIDGEETVVDFKAIAAGSVTVEGKVTRSGAPASGVMLSFAEVDAKPVESKGDSTPLRLVTADHDGMYTIDSLSPGEWSVTIQSVANLSDNMRQTFDFTLSDAPTQHEDFDLSGTGIEGTVRRKSDANPIAGARVSIDALDDSVKIDVFSRRVGSRRVGELFCDGDGHYRLSGIAPGKYLVSAGGLTMLNLGNSNFARSEPREVVVGTGQMTGNIDFTLVPGGSVTGKVTANGAAFSGASLFFLRDGDSVDRVDPFSSTITDEAGNFKADGLAEGTYNVIAKGSGYAPTWQRNVGVHPTGDPPTVDLSLVPGGEFRVRIVDAAGTDVTGSSTLAVTASDGLDISRLVTLYELLDNALAPGAGRSLGALAPGSYTVTARQGAKKVSVQATHGSAAQVFEVALP